MSDPTTDKALTPARLQAIQARLHPGRFLSRFSVLLDQEGDAILDTLFAIAKGLWTVDATTGERRLSSDPKDVMTAIRLIKDLGAFDEVVKHLLKIAQKGRPSTEGGTVLPDWAADYADADPTPPPPKVK